jgi:hypothetical protein
MNPAEAVTWGSFVQAAYDQYASDPGQASPAAIKNMPAGYTLVRTIQMTDFLGPVRSRVFYGFVAAGGAPQTAVVALRGTPPAPYPGPPSGLADPLEVLAGNRLVCVLTHVAACRIASQVSMSEFYRTSLAPSPHPASQAACSCITAVEWNVDCAGDRAIRDDGGCDDRASHEILTCFGAARASVSGAAPDPHGSDWPNALSGRR